MLMVRELAARASSAATTADLAALGPSADAVADALAKHISNAELAHDATLFLARLSRHPSNLVRLLQYQNTLFTAYLMHLAQPTVVLASYLEYLGNISTLLNGAGQREKVGALLTDHITGVMNCLLLTEKLTRYQLPAAPVASGLRFLGAVAGLCATLGV